MSAVVTKRDRERAFACVCNIIPWSVDLRWIETGEPSPVASKEMAAVAQALADERAEAEVRAWDEGHQGCLLFQDNPYLESAK